jgi:oligoribonuclease
MSVEPLTDEERSKGVMVWVDVETTGLDPRVDCVLEFGVKVTNRYLEVLREKDWLVLPSRDDWRDLIDSNPEVREMHYASGLVDEIQKLVEAFPEGRIGRPTREVASYSGWCWLVDVLKIEPGKLPMCGSNVANFDRQFAAEHLPVFHAFFHYRNIDVSSIKELCKVRAPKLYATIPAVENKPHRPLGDLEWTLRELDFYFTHFINRTWIEG